MPTPHATKGVKIPDTGFYFDPVKHKYYLDGKLMTGTTSVLSVLAKPALIQWAANLAAAHAYAARVAPGFPEALEAAIAKHGKLNSRAVAELDAKYPDFKAARTAHTKKKEAAGAHGTDLHALVEKYIKSCLADNEGRPHVAFFDEFKPIEKFIEWSVANVDHFLYSEREMNDPTRFFAGTADFGYIGKDGRRYIGDFKTSGGIYGIDYWLQVSAYRLLAEVEGDEPYDGMTITRLGKDDGKFEVQSMYEYETFRDCFLACLTIYRTQAMAEGMAVTTN